MRYLALCMMGTNASKSSLELPFENLMEFDIELVEKFEPGKSGKHKMLVDETLDSD
jgi:hypothetical protein